MDLPVATSHSLIFESFPRSPPEAKAAYRREKRTPTQSGPVSAATSSPLDTFHSLTVPPPPEASSLTIRGKGRRINRTSDALISVATISPLDTSHSLTKRSSYPPETNSLTVGGKRHDLLLSDIRHPHARSVADRLTVSTHPTAMMLLPQVPAARVTPSGENDTDET